MAKQMARPRQAGGNSVRITAPGQGASITCPYTASGTMAPVDGALSATLLHVGTSVYVPVPNPRWTGPGTWELVLSGLEPGEEYILGVELLDHSASAAVDFFVTGASKIGIAGVDTSVATVVKVTVNSPLPAPPITGILLGAPSNAAPFGAQTPAKTAAGGAVEITFNGVPSGSYRLFVFQNNGTMIPCQRQPIIVP